jgi:putative drug exporter of the RND superfamily
MTRTSRVLTFGVRRPRAALTVWVALVAILGVIGMGVGHNLSPTTLGAPGAASTLESQLSQQQFGKSVSAPILLTGPHRALDREGPQLAGRLAALPGADVISAWDGSSSSRSLRPSSTSAIMMVSITTSGRQSSHAIEREVARTVKGTITGPVHARVSGLDAIVSQLEATSLSAVHRAELIAMPILLIVLLIVFGSPLAAAIPAALGLGTVLSGFGLISLLASSMPLTEFATTAASMMGLALGVDYSLLVVSRFRDEISDSSDPDEIRRAATVAALRAGRTVAFAGGAIAILMLCALSVAAGTLLLSAVVGVIVVAAASVVSTILAAPAALVLLGRRVAPRRPARERHGDATSGRSWIAGASRSTVIAVGAAAALLVVGWQATSLATGPPDAGQLPAGSSAKRAYDAVIKQVGAGWVTPFEMLAVVPNGAITTREHLNALAHAQHMIARDRDVVTVVGPGALARRVQPLQHAEQTAASTNQSLGRSARDVTALGTSLGVAASGATRVQAGFAHAAAAVNSLASGAAGGGSALSALSAGLDQAAAGSRVANAGLFQAVHAANRVVGGGQTAAAGVNKLVSELSAGGAAASSAGPRLRSIAASLRAGATTLDGLVNSVSALGSAPSTASAQLATASQELSAMNLGRLDRHYRAALSAVQAAQSALASAPSASNVANQVGQAGAAERHVGDQIATLADAVGQLASDAKVLQQGATSLGSGITVLQQAQQTLAGGITKLAASDTALTHGLGTLSSGARTLAARIGALQGGAARIASGLAGEQQQTAGLASELNSGQRSATTASHRSPGQSSFLDTLAHRPKFFSSGYLVLAALEGTPAAQRGAIDYTLNLTRNGQAARLLIVPRSAAGAAATGALRKRLEPIANELAKATGARVVIGGPAAQLRDYTSAASGRMPQLIAVLMLATFVLLVPVFRSLLVPLVGVLLNLLSVAAAFGVLSLLSGGHHPLIGGPGYVDALGVSAMFAAVFALSIDYQVFLLMRMREGWIRTGSVVDGVEYGVSRTARVVVGAAAIMTAVFLAFATSDVAPIRQLGIGLAIAIAIDSTVVRLILLPYALRLGGRFTWWLPAWLDRRLPVIDIGNERRREADPAPTARDLAVFDVDRLIPGAPIAAGVVTAPTPVASPAGAA